MKKFVFILALSLFWQLGFCQTKLHSLLLSTHGDKIGAYYALTGSSLTQATFRNDYCTKELMDKSILFNIVTGNNVFINRIQHYGYSQYGELSANIGYGRLFGEKISVALQTIYLMRHASHYPCQHSFTIDISMAYCVNKKLDLGLAFYNPIRMRYSITGSEIIPMDFIIQAIYHPNEKLSALLSVEKKLPGELDIGLELFCHPTPPLILSLNCTLQKCGVSIHIPYKGLVCIFQCDWFYKISFSPGSSIQYYYNLPQQH